MMLIRIDDYPTGVRSILPDRVERLGRVLRAFEKRRIPYLLGVVPTLLTAEDYAFLRSLKCMTVAMHGYDHLYGRWVEGDPDNEFLGVERAEVDRRLQHGLSLLEEWRPRIYIPPFNTVTNELLDGLSEAGFRYVCTSEYTGYARFPSGKKLTEVLTPTPLYGRTHELLPVLRANPQLFTQGNYCVCLHVTWEDDEFQKGTSALEEFLDLIGPHTLSWDSLLEGMKPSEEPKPIVVSMPDSSKDTPCKILHITEQLSKGGAGRGLIALAKYSRRLGNFAHKVISLAPICDGVDPEGLEVIEAPTLDRLRYEIRQADIVQWHWWEDIPAMKEDLPPHFALLSCHTSGNRAPHQLSAFELNFADHIVLVCEHSLRLPIAKQIPPEKRSMIYMGADFERILPVTKLPHRGFTVGWIGTIDHNKFPLDFVEVHQGIQVPDLKVLLVGMGTRFMEVRNEVSRCGATDRFKFLGYRENMRNVLGRFDVYGFQLKPDTTAAAELNLQEVMAAEIPVVMLPIGGPQYMIEDGVSGIIAADQKEYQRALEELYHHPEERVRLGRNAKQRALELFGAENAARQYNQLYDRILQQRHAASRAEENSGRKEDLAVIRQALDEGRFDDARTLIERAHGSSPKAVEYRNLQAELQYLTGKEAEAKAALFELVKHSPCYLPALNNLAIVLWNEGDRQAALQYVERALTVDPRDRESILNYAQFLGALGKAEEMRRICAGYLEYQHDEEIAALLKGNDADGEKHLVSAIVSTYNAENFLRGCLEDLEAQTIAEQLEIIVVDSGSQQNERMIVEEFQKRYSNIKYLRTENRETVYQAWNRGIKAASGKYLTNANSDDRHHPEAFARMVEVLERRPEIALVYADVAVTAQENATFADARRSGVFRWPAFAPRRLFEVCYIGPQPMWRRDLHEKYGYFDPEFVSAGDYEFWLRFAAKESFLHLPEILGLYLSSPDSVEHRNQSISIAESEKARERHWPTEWGGRPSPEGNYLVRYPALTPKQMAEISKPLVSVIIPTFNRPYFLRDALTSLERQTFTQFEVVVINDGGDDVGPIIREFNDSLSIQYIQLPQNIERSAARNEGIRAANGTYIAYLDDDDQYYPQHLDTLVNYLENRECQVAYTDAVKATWEAVDGEYRIAKREVSYSVDFDYDRILHGNFVPILCLMHAKACLDEVGFFDETLDTHEDMDLLIRLSRRYEMCHLPVVTCEFSWREDGSSTTSSRWAEFPKSLERVYEKHREQAKDKPQVLELQAKTLDWMRQVVEARQASKEAPSEASGGALVSAIVSTYNAEAFLRGCLEDLERQTLADRLEIIVVDSGSRQNERAIVEEFQRRYSNIKYIRTEERESIYQAWNRGIMAASGRYLTNANTDDRHRPDAFELMARELEQDPHLALVYGDVFVTNEEHQDFFAHIRSGYHVRPDYSKEIMLSGCHMGPQPMWRRSLHEAIGYFSETLKSAGDYEFWCRIALHHPMKHLRQFLGLYYENPKGFCNSDLNLSALETRQIIQQYESAFPRPTQSFTNNHQHCHAVKAGQYVNIGMVTYGRLEFTKRAIAALIENTCFPYVLTVVDNGSTDGTVAYLKELRRQGIVKNLLLLDENVGVARASNLAWAQEPEAEYYLKLDNDIVITKRGWLTEMVEVVDRVPELGAIAYNFEPYSYEVQSIRGQALRVKNHANLGGACILIPRRTHEQLGFWSEDYGLYGEEDADYGFRIRALGLLNAYMLDENIGFHLPAGKAARIDPETLVALDGIEETEHADYRRWKDEIRRKSVKEQGLVQKNFFLYQKGIKPFFAEASLDERMQELYPGAGISLAVSDHPKSPERAYFFHPLAWETLTWTEVVSSYVAAVPPDARATLVLWLDPDAGIAMEAAQERILDLIHSLVDDPAFTPDILMISTPFSPDELEYLRSVVHWVNMGSRISSEVWQLPLLSPIEPNPASHSMVIVTYNSAATIRACVESVLATIRPTDEVIIVDNASRDMTPQILTSLARGDARVHPIFCERNLGFSAGTNRGIAQAKGKHIVLLNPDTVVYAGWLEQMAKLASIPGVGAVGPTSDYVYGYQKWNFHVPSLPVDAPPGLIAETLAKQNDGQGMETRVLIGFCMLLPRSVLLEVGLLDEKLFLGNDDLDLSWRMQLAGKKMLIAKAAFVQHVGQVSFDSEPKEQTRRLVQESTDALARKLLAHYGPGRVPLPEVLWGVDWFHPTPGILEGRGLVSREEQASRRLKTSIVVLTLNQLEMTRFCFKSLFQWTHDFELIVVDNGSTDGTIDYLKELAAGHQNVRLVLNPSNRGFAWGCNQGLALASGDYLVLLNNDTVLTEGWLDALILAANKPRVGIVGPRSNFVVGPQMVEAISYDPASLGGLEIFAKQWRHLHSNQTREVNRVIGFCMLIRREVLDTIGGLDTSFGTGNYEDDDYCLRAMVAGFRILMVDEVFIHHFGNATFKGERIDYRNTLQRNWELFKRKWHLPGSEPYEKGYRYEDALQNPFDPSIHTEPVFIPSITPAELPERRSHNIALVSSDRQTIKQALDAFIGAFDANDDVMLHLFAGGEVQKVQDDVLTVIAELGLDPDSIPEVSLLDVPRTPLELPAYLRTTDLVLGAPNVLLGAKDMGLLTLEAPSSEQIRAALGFPKQERLIQRFPESALAHKWCKGQGLEIGAAAHNPFGLNTRNVGIEEGNYLEEQIRWCGEAVPIDIQAEGDAIPLPDESQDFIVSSHVVEHFPNLIKALLEHDRLLKPGGIWFMIHPHRDASSADRGRSLTTLEHHIFDFEHKVGRETHEKTGSDHFHVETLESFLEVIHYVNHQGLFSWEIVETAPVDDKAGNGFTVVCKKCP